MMVDCRRLKLPLGCRFCSIEDTALCSSPFQLEIGVAGRWDETDKSRTRKTASRNEFRSLDVM